MLTVLYLILGCFLDALAMVFGTIPIVFPIVVALGIGPVWFGIFLVIMAELALIWFFPAIVMWLPGVTAKLVLGPALTVRIAPTAR